MDKQDELAALIHEAHRTAPYPWWHTEAEKCRMATHIAAAVRSFMGSDEVVKATAEAVCGARCDAERPDPGKGLDEFIARAAIRTALGGDGES